MKKTINKILLLPFLVLLVTFTGCFNLYSKEEVSIVIDESFFSDFNVTDNVVGVNCIVTLLSLGVRKLKALEITQSERFQGPFFVHLFQIS